MVAGKAVDIPTLVDSDVDHDRRERTGMPNGATLTVMMDAADALYLTEAPRTRRGGVSNGTPFHIIQYVPDNTPLTVTSQPVDQRAGSAVCYENILFNNTLVGRVSAIVDNTIVCQNVVPRTRCRAGYRQLIQNGSYTIVVPSDDGYDGAPDSTTFLFASIGLVFHRH